MMNLMNKDLPKWKVVLYLTIGLATIVWMWWWSQHQAGH